MTLYFSSADDADDADFFLNSPLERGQGVCDNHPLYTMLMYSNTPLPLSRGEKKYPPNKNSVELCGEKDIINQTSTLLVILSASEESEKH